MYYSAIGNSHVGNILWDFFFKKYFADLWTEDIFLLKVTYISYIYIYIYIYKYTYYLPISSFTAPFWPFREVFSYLMHRELTSGICKSGLVFIHVVWSSFRRGKNQKSKLHQVFSWRVLYTFSLFELKKNVMQLLSKAPKKKKNTTIFFQRHTRILCCNF